MNNEVSLLSTNSRVAVPYVKVVVGDYTLGVFDKVTKRGQVDSYGVYTLNKIQYPNYIKSLQIQKLNGVVNKYTLALEYAITEQNDPNFIEKIFGSIKDTRKIILSYGDVFIPSYSFKDEEAIVTKISKSFNIQSAVKSFTVTAISSGALASSGTFTFEAKTIQPSVEIENILYNRNSEFGLLDLFYGMSNRDLVAQKKLIPHDDATINLEQKINMTVFDYLEYLTDCMQVASERTQDKKTFFRLDFVDDISGVFNGPYFRVVKINSLEDKEASYKIDVGVPDSKDIVIGLQEETDETFILLYNFAENLTQEHYVERINNRGEIYREYAPIISSNSPERIQTPQLKNWWASVTEFPTKINLQIKGLLKPAILMTHVRLNVYYFGKKDIISGLYIVTKQIDRIDATGYTTTLGLTRIGGSSLDSVV